MSQLPKNMPQKVSSASELLAIAHAMEREAARRYHELAARMRLRNDNRLADLFAFLSRIEDKHANQIEQRAIDVIGHTPDPTQIRWDVPETFDEEEGSSRLLTPYLALAIAVRNEERAFAFYCYIAAEAANDAIRAFAEDLAKEELNHAVLLRHERRKAYREEGRAARPATRQNVPESVRDLLVFAAEMEGSAASYHAALAERLRHNHDIGADSFAQAAEDEQGTAASIAARLAQEPAKPPAPPGEPTIEDGLRLLEQTFAFYADVADRSKDERVVHEAQTLAERAVRRLSLARGRLPSLPF